jgi:hypothetical protein|tara:strand:+ start:159 stop:362 length:204 start_codon:yes stop_codon:yes gene_type:complete
MEKTILVIRRCKYGNTEARYDVLKVAQNLEQATRYKVALETLNTEEEVSYILYNELGQLDYTVREVA